MSQTEIHIPDVGPEITVTVPQGIGDIFWVYQKLFPLFERINFKIAIISDQTIQKRAFAFIKTWPKVQTVTFEKTTPAFYEQLSSQKKRLADLLKDSNHIVFACNRFLEEGIRLENIDPGYPVAWGIPLPQNKPELPDDYVVAYVSGVTPGYVWDIGSWGRFIRGIYIKERLTQPLIIVGAEYDKWAATALAKNLNGLTNIDIKLNMPPKTVNAVLANTRLFIGYQSGLNILADNFGTNHIMVHFPHLKHMRTSWMQPGHWKAGIHQSFTFDQSVDYILSVLRPFPPKR